MGKRLLDAHPLFLAAAPVLLLAHANLAEVELWVIGVPLLLSVAAATVLWLTQGAIRRNWRKAAISSSLLIALFFSYGHLVNLVVALQLLESSRSLQRVLVIVPLLVLLVAAELVLNRSKSDLTNLSQTLGLLGVLLCLIPGLRLGYRLLEAKQPLTLTTNVEFNRTLDPLPDIYYIVLDGYARNDTLREYYDLDNSSFTSYLREQGFFVAQDSHSNYSITRLSLASSLNMQHIHELAVSFRSNAETLYKLVQNNDVGRILKAAGYRYVHFRTDYAPTFRSDLADESYASPTPRFYDVLAKTTAIRTLWKRRWRIRAPKLLLFQFEKLKDIPHKPEPTFTFAHIICPHPPYWFDRHGNIALRDGEGDAVWGNPHHYREQLLFVNQKMREAIDAIIAESDTPPIVIIHSDHGTVMPVDGVSLQEQRERIRFGHRILYAIKAPESCRDQLYASMTPVNTFRVILNGLFGADLPLLEDRTYYSSVSRPATFTDVTGLLRDPVPQVANEQTRGTGR